MLIGLTYDLRDDYRGLALDEEQLAEFDSEETISHIEGAIQHLGHGTDRIGNFMSLCARLAAGQKWDLVFNVAEGLTGRWRESQVPSILEAYGIGYTFSDPLACALTLDKGMAKTIARDHGLPTAAFQVVDSIDDISGVAMEYPLFAKPLAEGTGKGINGSSRIESKQQLEEVCRRLMDRFAQPVLVEEFLPGREFTTGVLGNNADAAILGTMEITLSSGSQDAIYSYHAKEMCEREVKYLPFKNGPLYERLTDLALGSYRALQCRDAARVDIRCDRGGNPCFMEINPLPGLHPTHSDLPMIATQEGVRYDELIGAIIDNAAKRLGRYFQDSRT